MPRTAIAIGLSDSDFAAVQYDLNAAGYDPIRTETAADLEFLLGARNDVGVAIIDCESDFDRTLEMFAVLHEGGRNIPALLLMPAMTLGRMTIGGRKDSGDEYFARPFTGETIRRRLDAMLAKPADAPPEPVIEVRPAVVAAAAAPVPRFEVGDAANRGKLVIVFNPKGGVGKTTVSINLGATLQLRKKKRVLLVDCDAVTGHVAPSLGMPDLRTLAEAWLWDKEHNIEETVAQISVPHSSGIRILALAHTPFHTEILVPERVVSEIAKARSAFDYVILDLHPDFGPLNLALFALADRILVPVTPDVPCILAAVQFREVAAALDIRDRLRLVINRANSGVPAFQVEQTVKIPTIARIRSAGPLFYQASDSGKSALESDPNAKAIEDIDDLAESLIADLAGRSAQKKGGFLGLFGRS